MARPSLQSPALVTTGEATDAAGFTRSQRQSLMERRAGPFAEADVMELARTGQATEDTLAHLGIMAGIHAGGFPLLMAGGLARAFLRVEAPNHEPARFAMIDRLIPTYRPGMSVLACIANALATGGDAKAMQRQHDDDLLFHVVNRTHAFSQKRNPRIATVVPDGFDGRGPIPLARLTGMTKRGDAIEVDDLMDEEWTEARAIAVHTEFRDVLASAVAVMTVNASLSIRRAFLHVHDARIAKGTPLPTDPHDRGPF